MKRKPDPKKLIEEKWQRFGRWVLDKRNQGGWTQEACAERADMQRQQWGRIEKGAPTKEITVMRVADALEADREEALRIIRSPSPSHLENGQTATVEEALKTAFFFDQKGLSQKDIEKIRPLMEVTDREIDRLKKEGEQKQGD